MESPLPVPRWHEAPCIQTFCIFYSYLHQIKITKEHTIYCPLSIQAKPTEKFKQSNTTSQYKSKLVLFLCSQCNDTSCTSTQKWYHDPNNSCLELESRTKDFLFCAHWQAEWMIDRPTDAYPISSCPIRTGLLQVTERSRKGRAGRQPAFLGLQASLDSQSHPWLPWFSVDVDAKSN